MKNIDQAPWWVKVVYANVSRRKVACWLTIVCAVFTLYCFPWSRYSDAPLVAQIFVFDDWEWFLSMLPMTIWYWVALIWIDRHGSW
ncbi:hypothetical protein [Methylophilus aquaticus]|uniref:Uncharacterized protein n=1 Tax=Methylophilus aquaticus TaxID=1971610 RepID=A0ABT9JT64_9PROT|nr:hypothetical protein [Methylophilus aquaticus]MDP8567674.1 hypothetical protein [Methylophilus aquaticus]